MCKLLFCYVICLHTSFMFYMVHVTKQLLIVMQWLHLETVSALANSSVTAADFKVHLCCRLSYLYNTFCLMLLYQFFLNNNRRSRKTLEIRKNREYRPSKTCIMVLTILQRCEDVNSSKSRFNHRKYVCNQIRSCEFACPVCPKPTGDANIVLYFAFDCILQQLHPKPFLGSS